VQLSQFRAYRDGTEWSTTLTSRTSTAFLADVTHRLGPDDLGSDGFGMEDVVATFGERQLDVTLYFTGSGEFAVASGVLIAVHTVDVTTTGWQPLADWDGSPLRFCTDSGAVVLGTAEAFDDVRELRSTAASFDLAEKIVRASAPIFQPDRLFFSADVSCYGCWSLGTPGDYRGIYIDLDPEAE
jgi:hypothetical protein